MEDMKYWNIKPLIMAYSREQAKYMYGYPSVWSPFRNRPAEALLYGPRMIRHG